MKKAMTWFLILMVCLGACTGCGQEAAPSPAAPEPLAEEEIPEEQPAPAEQPAEEEAAPSEPEPEEDAVASGPCGEQTSWAINEEGVLTISGTGSMGDWKGSYVLKGDGGWAGDQWDYVVREIVVEDGVTDLSPYAFDDCSELTKVTLPDSLITIGGCAFGGTEKLEQLQLPESLEELGAYAFSYSGLQELTLPKHLHVIGASALATSESLGVRIDPENEVLKFLDNALYNLETKTLLMAQRSYEGVFQVPDGIVNIGPEAFRDCEQITELILPETVEVMGVEALRGCYNLTKMNVPSKLKGLISGGIQYGPSLRSIEIAPENPNYLLEDGCLYELSENRLFLCIDPELEEIWVRPGTESIDSNVFEDFEHLTKIHMPQSLLEVGSYAFHGCVNLKQVNYPGTYEQWKQVTIGEDNGYLESAILYTPDK